MPAVKLTHMDYPAEDEQEPPLLIAHGLFGSARNFHTLAKKLAATRRVIAVDMRNHGDAPWGKASYAEMAEDLAEAIERLAGGRASLLGHSMGGKAAMGLALSQPDLLAALIVADIAPVAYDHSHADYVEAMQGVDLAKVDRRSDADPMLEDAVPEKPLRAFLLHNLEIEDGEASWRINLDALENGMDDLIGWDDDWPHDSYDGPTLFLRGGASDYAAEQYHDRIREHFPEAEIEALDGAGHWLHAEQPDAFVDAVDRWLRQI